ncbi:hypothetical protein B7H20_25620 [Pseudomonas aeruginosa]|uniref:hypothetical protein n=1 Tax=Pseudomonas aeruginosa TaxID=287 RepID=UPI000A0FF62C|nr:hypothetical protein [Pseudomonas aeruginosa]ORL55488.1 hypothetical protein B7H20_25620 [Pseudomonas aeruginosa]HCL3279588.1 hypothetical protein [Pseudomonas aeruginosa]
MRDGAVMSLGLELDGPAWGRIKGRAMGCFVCNVAEVEKLPSPGDRALVKCPQCGSYAISGTVTNELDKGRWLATESTQQWLDEQRRNGVDVPLITTDVALWDGFWIKK